MKRQYPSGIHKAASKKAKQPSPLENLFEQVSEINAYYIEHCTPTTIAVILRACVNSAKHTDNCKGMLKDIKSKHKTLIEYEHRLRTSHQRQDIIAPVTRLKKRLSHFQIVLTYMSAMFNAENINHKDKAAALSFLDNFIQLMPCQDEIAVWVKTGNHQKLRAYKPLFDGCLKHELAFCQFLRSNNDKNVLRLYFFEPLESINTLSKKN